MANCELISFLNNNLNRDITRLIFGCVKRLEHDDERRQKIITAIKKYHGKNNIDVVSDYEIFVRPKDTGDVNVHFIFDIDSEDKFDKFWEYIEGYSREEQEEYGTYIPFSIPFVMWVWASESAFDTKAFYSMDDFNKAKNNCKIWRRQ